jgi:hypothetical protein
MGAATAVQEAHCWGGPSTCQDAWVPDGIEYWDGLQPWYLTIACYSAIALLAGLRAAHAAAARATRRIAGAQSPPPPAFLPINAWVSVLWAASFGVWAASAPWVVDWRRGAMRVDGPVLAVGQIQAVVYAVACVIELAAKADGFTWLSYAHHFVAIVDVAFILTLVRNPYEIFVGWLYLGNTFLECALYASLCLHHAAGLTDAGTPTGRRWRRASVALNRAQLFFSASHNLLFQAGVNAYVAAHWRAMSPAFRWSFLAFNAILLLENVYCVHASAATLVRKGAATRAERALYRGTAFVKRLAECSCCRRGARREAGAEGAADCEERAADGAKGGPADAPPAIVVAVMAD